MHHVIAQGSSGSMVGQTDFLSGDVLTSLWGADAGISLAAKKKKTAKKPAKKPAKKKPKPRPTRNRPGCETTGKACGTSR